MKAIVVIPTYNESDNIVKIISAVLKSAPGIHVLIVDDNSPDGTSYLVEEMIHDDNRVHLLKRSGKMGLGTAYCEVFTLALAWGYDIVIEMDADFSHNPDYLPLFLVELKPGDVVIGSRDSNGVNVVNWPMRRLTLSYGAYFNTLINSCMFRKAE